MPCYTLVEVMVQQPRQVSTILPLNSFERNFSSRKDPFLETITFASGSELGGIPNYFWVSYEDAFCPLWVRAYQAETFPHKRRSPKPLRNDNLGFLLNHSSYGVVSTDLDGALFNVNVAVSKA